MNANYNFPQVYFSVRNNWFIFCEFTNYFLQAYQLFWFNILWIIYTRFHEVWIMCAFKSGGTAYLFLLWLLLMSISCWQTWALSSNVTLCCKFECILAFVAERLNQYQQYDFIFLLSYLFLTWNYSGLKILHGYY